MLIPSSTITRRHLLLSAGAAAVVGSQRLAGAVEPIRRTDKPKFKFSLAAYSYRDLLTGKPPKLTLADFIDDCARMGLEGTELTSYYFPADPTPAYLRQLKQQTFRLGLDISGTAVGNDFCHPPGAERDKQIALVKQWVDRAEMLGAPVIRIFSGQAKTGQSEQDAHRLAVEAIEHCCQYAGQHGVFLALENHGGLTTAVEGLLRLINDVKSEWFGVNLDTGNFHSADPYADLARIAPYAVNVQVKVSMNPGGGQKEPADYRRLAKILRDSRYRGYIVLEYEEKEDPREACPRQIDELRQAFA
ncbi:MAG TPA: sugar phosphate isomerase/epimerase family protein [Pirellulales bacterium]|jgi:sugar phosphate isomerase/epimerase|nr:sugar phosphate isomerase/epimerase family protein [Pirellulales bacterium]